MGEPTERTRNLLIFHSSGLDCAFPLEQVREVVPMARLSTPPGLPSALAGFLDLRGTAVPIVRMDRLFNLLEQQAGLHTPMIVLHGTLRPIGILVESVRGIEAVPSGCVLEVPGDGTFRGCAKATLQLGGDTIHVLSAVALLAANEERLLADYGAMSQARLRQLEERT